MLDGDAEAVYFCEKICKFVVCTAGSGVRGDFGKGVGME